MSVPVLLLLLVLASHTCHLFLETELLLASVRLDPRQHSATNTMCGRSRRASIANQKDIDQHQQHHNARRRQHLTNDAKRRRMKRKGQGSAWSCTDQLCNERIARTENTGLSLHRERRQPTHHKRTYKNNQSQTCKKQSRNHKAARTDVNHDTFTITIRKTQRHTARTDKGARQQRTTMATHTASVLAPQEHHREEARLKERGPAPSNSLPSTGARRVMDTPGWWCVRTRPGAISAGTRSRSGKASSRPKEPPGRDLLQIMAHNKIVEVLVGHSFAHDVAVGARASLQGFSNNDLNGQFGTDVRTERADSSESPQLLHVIVVREIDQVWRRNRGHRRPTTLPITQRRL